MDVETCATCKRRHVVEYIEDEYRYRMKPRRIEPKCDKPRFQGPGTPGTPYYPSNGTEGDFFLANWCEKCVYWNRAQLHGQDVGCAIYAESFLLGSHDRPPSAWVHADDGWGSCEMFNPDSPDAGEDDPTRIPFMTATRERMLYKKAMVGQ